MSKRQKFLEIGDKCWSIYEYGASVQKEQCPACSKCGHTHTNSKYTVTNHLAAWEVTEVSLSKSPGGRIVGTYGLKPLKSQKHERWYEEGEEIGEDIENVFFTKEEALAHAKKYKIKVESK